MSVTYIEEGDAATPSFMNNLLNQVSGGIFNGKSYGVVGDGIRDKSDAIQRAIDAAASAKGTVFIPAGTYLLGPGLSCDSGNFRICGDTRRATTLLAGGAITMLAIGA